MIVTARGSHEQQLIYHENMCTMMYCCVTGIGTSVVVFVMDFFIFKPPGMFFKVFWVLSVLTCLAAIATMSVIVRPLQNEQNDVVDAGTDFGDPDSPGKHCKDAIMLSCLVQLASMIWYNFIYLIVFVIGFASVKLWTRVPRFIRMKKLVSETV